MPLISDTRTITRYLYRIPRFLLYPLRPPALWLLLAVPAVMSIATTMLGGLLQALLLLLLVFLVLTFCYQCLGHAAQGASAPPGVAAIVSGGDWSGGNWSGADWALPLLQVIILLVFGALGIIAHALLGAVGGLLVLVFTVVVLPVSVMVLGAERAFINAVNPLHLWGVVAVIGWPYLGLIGLLVAMEMALYGAMGVLSAQVPGPAGVRPSIAVLSLVMVYFLVMYFHILGNVIYLYHEELGFEVHAGEEDEGQSIVDPGLKERLARHDALMAENSMAAALQELRLVSREYPANADLHLRLWRLARLQGDAGILAQETDWLLHRQLRSGRIQQAVDLLRGCLELDPLYRPKMPEVVAALARELRARGRLRQALALIIGFHRRYPGHADTARVYVLAAQMLIKEAGQPDHGRRILAYLQQHHAGSEYQPQMNELQRILDNMELAARREEAARVAAARQQQPPGA